MQYITLLKQTTANALVKAEYSKTYSFLLRQGNDISIFGDFMYNQFTPCIVFLSILIFISMLGSVLITLSIRATNK